MAARALWTGAGRVPEGRGQVSHLHGDLQLFLRPRSHAGEELVQCGVRICSDVHRTSILCLLLAGATLAQLVEVGGGRHDGAEKEGWCWRNRIDPVANRGGALVIRRSLSLKLGPLGDRRPRNYVCYAFWRDILVLVCWGSRGWVGGPIWARLFSATWVQPLGFLQVMVVVVNSELQILFFSLLSLLLLLLLLSPFRWGLKKEETMLLLLLQTLTHLTEFQVNFYNGAGGQTNPRSGFLFYLRFPKRRDIWHFRGDFCTCAKMVCLGGL